MPYAIDVGSVREVLGDLPRDALLALAEALEVVEESPWDGEPLVDRNPGGAVRTMSFGSRGLLTYVVLEQFHRVDVVQVHWAA
ncbi:hypothetical protein [Actinomycetospora cinnamomea]|uniref:mRNA-degrading endonuclease RelE of RelBE toxin-antitoxin system n=1 Tax=Actinomycetospora cinnamomea TaxID=663609 RepID=A0A2U1E5A8_9PSEU|nr:hypothetical protein [Actinomycetospora cinnamomea]PVY95111.1 hypothetical protein C8D89_1401 [Actinomycetospora cinnamomea]